MKQFQKFFVQTRRATSLLCAILLLTTFTANAQISMTATEWVENVTIGWNLGNTLDATSDWNSNQYNETPAWHEKSWGNPVTTKAMITALKDAGFNAIRIPVSWSKVANENYIIRTDWMARVTEVVDYAVENDMYIVLNTHHDENIFKFTDAKKAQSLVAFRKIWEQIADNFKDYDGKLVFEGLNEPRTKGSAAEWSGGTAEEHSVLNEHHQVFVDVVRASGGNNGTRILLINAYGASPDAKAMNALELPTDVVPNKLIVSFHNYSPYNFALNRGDGAVSTWSRSKVSDTSPITYPINNYFNKFVNNGVPVIIGEFGAIDKNNEAIRADWTDYYVKYAESKGMKCFWWDNGAVMGNGELFGLFNRIAKNFYFPEIARALGLTPPTVAVTGVTLNITTLALVIDETEQLTHTIAPSYATNRTVTWASDNASVATVVNGLITANSAGTATITVTTEDGNKTAQCVVTVSTKTAIDNIAADVLKIYPNPTTGQLTITMNNEHFDKLNAPQLIMNNAVEIFDYAGRTVGANLCVRPDNTIDISHLPNGIYFVQVNGKRVKIVKQ
ncbi:MAG: cellulase family glycosylhydrolase [Bacteroidetes bacterium]|nr:cellulase family glycosylhydrolase [Bacteroidota bacterium]